MINIVIVSHSKHLAEGIEALANQMLNPTHCRLAIAAGVDDEAHPIGTDAVKIMTAIESLAEADAIIVMMDLGSAILSTETAIELLDTELAQKVTLCSAPLVEGTLAAVVAASSGASLEKVLEEANHALTPKKMQLGENMGGSEPNDVTPSIQIHGKEAHWVVKNPHGLHVRPAATLVELLSKFRADYQLIKGDRRINPLSLNQLSLIQIRQGDEITLIASGEQENEAIDAFLALAKQGFGEALPDELTEQSLTGTLVPASPIKGPAFIWHELELAPIENLSAPLDSTIQIEQFNQAIKDTLNDLKHYAEKANHTLDEQIGAIFNGHIMMLDDEELLTNVIDRIKTDNVSAQQSWTNEMKERIQLYRTLSDPYLRARELDLRDLRNQVLYHLQQKTPPKFTPSQPSILVAKELFPSTLIQFDATQLLAITLAKGDSCSHSAIIATQMGLPMLVHLGDGLLKIKEAQELTLDLKSSELIIGSIN